MTERIDYRTPREVAIDQENEAIAARFRELMEYFPSAARAMEQVAKERRSTRETIRCRLVKCGAYVPGKKAGRNSGCQVKE